MKMIETTMEIDHEFQDNILEYLLIMDIRLDKAKLATANIQ